MLSTAEIIYTICYTLLFTTLITRLRFFRNFSISVKWITGIFLFKVLVGTAYGLIHYYLYEGGDTFAYFYDGLIIRKSLSANPAVFLKLVFGINSRPPGPDILPYAQAMSYWNDMGSYFIIRFHALASLFTFGHYYANAVIYNFFTLIGSLYLFEFICRFLPEKKFLIVTALFFFPSVTFWSCGIHKDGISLAAIGWILYFASSLAGQHVPFPAKNKAPILWRNLWWLLFGLWLLFVSRIYLLLLITPCIIAFLWVTYAPKQGLLKYLLVFVLFYSVIINLKWLYPPFDLLGKMSEQQLQFKSSTGINMPLPLLEPTVYSLLKLIPISLYNCLFQPLPWEVTSVVQVSPLIDNLVMLLLMITALWFFIRKRPTENTFLLFCIFFALSVFIFAGEIVPNIGALVRYRMPGVLFLLMACFTVIESRIKAFSEK